MTVVIRGVLREPSLLITTLIRRVLPLPLQLLKWRGLGEGRGAA
jgi:hypothetical protein